MKFYGIGESDRKILSEKIAVIEKELISLRSQTVSLANEKDALLKQLEEGKL